MNKRSFPKHVLWLSCAAALAGCSFDDMELSDQVVPENSIPEFTSQAVTSAVVNQDYSYAITATDADGDALTMTADTIPSWLAFDAASGVLSGTPANSSLIGAHDVVISVTDGKDAVSQSFTVTVAAAEAEGQWVMVWSDEFDGSSLNMDNWNIQTGDGSEFGLVGWGNNELQWYSEDNITVADGNLVITAKAEASNGYPYTSGRLRTDGKVDVKYGRIEGRIKGPLGKGLWSAFWMLPTDSEYGGWASGGEIDIMELVNPGTDGNDVTHGTIHYGMAWPQNVSAGDNADVDAPEEFHVYAVEWEENEIRWYLDDHHYATVSSETWWSYFYKDLESGYQTAEGAPFNQEFHLLVNLAVGGNWPGSPDGNTQFPAELVVDYIRVYECDSGLESGAGCASNINSTIEPPAPDSFHSENYPLYTDSVQPLTWTIGEEQVSRELAAAVAWNNGGIAVTEVDSGGDHGMVLDITTGDMGNVAINAVDGGTFTLKGMGTSDRWWEIAAGELKFDIYIDSSVTPDDGVISIKMDSGWPALGFSQLNVADLPKDEWTSVSVKVNDFLVNSGDQPLDTAAVLNLFVIEFSGAAHVMLDNIALACGHKDDNGCGIAPPNVEIEEETVVVFDDAVNSELWTNGMGAWDDAANSDYYDGASANHITWSVVDSDDAARGQVVEVNFSTSGASGVFYFQSASPVNMATFADGYLVFDVNVVDYGTNSGGLTYKVDCLHPCGTGDQPLGVIADGAWETVVIPVSDLEAAGLRIEGVNSPLVLFPTWGDQSGVTLQIDNVRYQNTMPDGAPTPDPEPDPAPDPDPVEPGDEMVSNGSFDDGTAGWINSIFDVNIVNEDGNNIYQVDVTAAGNPWDVNISQVLTLEAGSTYVLEFRAKASVERTILAGVGFNHDPWSAVTEEVSLTTEWQTFTYTLTPDFGDDNSRVLFDMGAATGVVSLDDISLIQQ